MILDKEIDLIYRDTAREAVRECIKDRAEDIIYYPASISGKYHPPEERGPGGLVVHIARLCRIIEDLSKHLDFTCDERDMLVIAAILHDISNIDLSEKTEYGTITRDHKIYSEFHGELSAQITIEYFVKHGFDPKSKYMLELHDIITSHMGYWIKNAKKPTRKLEIIFSMLDYIDTRTYVHIELPGMKLY